MSEKHIEFPANQQAYEGILIPSELNPTELLGNLTSHQEGLLGSYSCLSCVEFNEISVEPFRVKSCNNCNNEYAYCFCNKLCKISFGTRKDFNYEYLNCDKMEC